MTPWSAATTEDGGIRFGGAALVTPPCHAFQLLRVRQMRHVEIHPKRRRGSLKVLTVFGFALCVRSLYVRVL